MSRTSRTYTNEFKRNAVELTYIRGNVKEVSQELDLHSSVLHRWRKELKGYGKNSFPGRGIPKMTDDQKEIARLRRQIKDIELERDILKKAISIFFKSDRKSTNL
tara:strand:- start:69 stop:383 length:315 start_codon:yes stop_codon:yes gene_type:complete